MSQIPLVLDDGTYLVSSSYSRGKDFVRSPFRYPGGKYYALKFIIPILEAIPHSEYREPFVGGGSVFFAKTKSESSWINDLEVDVIDVYRALQHPAKLEELATRVSGEVASRERHAEIREMVPSDEAERVFKTFYLNRTSYSGIINKPAWGYEIGYSSPPANWPSTLRAASVKMADTRITSFDFEQVLEAPSRGLDVLAYLDPPYFLADQKRAYTRSFVEDDHLRLVEMLKGVDYPFLLSYDDCEAIRDLYSWANIYPREWNHNTANSSGPRKIGKELLIANFKIWESS